jgi:hypothetical protein
MITFARTPEIIQLYDGIPYHLILGWWLFGFGVQVRNYYFHGDATNDVGAVPMIAEVSPQTLESSSADTDSNS